MVRVYTLKLYALYIYNNFIIISKTIICVQSHNMIGMTLLCLDISQIYLGTYSSHHIKMDMQQLLKALLSLVEPSVSRELLLLLLVHIDAQKLTLPLQS